MSRSAKSPLKKPPNSAGKTANSAQSPLIEHPQSDFPTLLTSHIDVPTPLLRRVNNVKKAHLRHKP